MQESADESTERRTRSQKKPKKLNDSTTQKAKKQRSASVIAMEMELIRKEKEIKKLKKENKQLSTLVQDLQARLAPDLPVIPKKKQESDQRRCITPSRSITKPYQNE